MGSLLVTGSTGMLGRELVRALLLTTDQRVVLLVRQRVPIGEMLAVIFRLAGRPRLRSRLRVVRGDVTQPGLGLSARDQAALTREVTAVLHAAADTRFDRTLVAARQVNVRGTRNVLALAQRLPRLDRVGYLSTAYVSGRRTGTVLEAEREHDAGFVNSYERSKYEAEAVMERATSVPWTIYRLSTLIGNVESGYTSHFTTPHHALRIMHLGLASVISGDPRYSVDLLPTDFAAATVATLFCDRFRPSQVFHLVAGPEKSFRLEEIIERSYELLGELDPSWGSRPHPRPAIASEAAFNLLVQAAHRSPNELLRQVTGTLRHFAAQFCYPKTFDTATTHAALPGYEATVPDIRTYYPRVVRFCLETAWGRHA